MKQAVLRIARALGVFAICRRLYRNHLAILCYHGIWLGGEPHYGDCLYMSAGRFQARMRLIQQLGYTVLPLGEAVDRWLERRLPPRSVVITIDDGWYGTFRDMLPPLKGHGFPATLYVTTYFVRARYPVINVLLGYVVFSATDVRAAAIVAATAFGLRGMEDVHDTQQLADRLLAHIDTMPDTQTKWEAVVRFADALHFPMGAVQADRRFELMTPAELKAAREQGFDIQLHTHRHRMYEFDPAKFESDLALNRFAIEEMSGTSRDSIRHFCYPSGVYDPKVYPVLRKLGVRSATTTEFGLNAPGTDRFALRRILDCESLSDLDIEARLSGFWGLVSRLRRPAPMGEPAVRGR